MMKRIMLAIVAVTSLTAAKSAHAYEGPWCAYMAAGRDFYTSRCDLANYEACRAEIFATPGTWCTQNPRFAGFAKQPVKMKKKRVR